MCCTVFIDITNVPVQYIRMRYFWQNLKLLTFLHILMKFCAEKLKCLFLKKCRAHIDFPGEEQEIHNVPHTTFFKNLQLVNISKHRIWITHKIN